MDLLTTDPASRVLSKYLDAALLRQEIIANNIANVNTPGFKRSYVVFEEELRAALGEKGRLQMRKTHPRHVGGGDSLDGVLPAVGTDMSTSTRVEGNNVDVEEEMAQLAMNGINYYLAAQQLNNKLAMLSHVISEGRR